uniref:TARBP2 subunit of RISC loading complex n=1 Tax=Lynx canadensis TaxID=61383 RepID=A0A667G5Y7_LYNCA
MSEEEQGSGTTTGCGLPSIEQMLAANPGKTPISLLQEYGTRIGKTPVYDLLKAEGQAHQPNFTFRVTVGDTSCTGQGPSKKAAKHKAAEVALKHLKGGSMLEPALEDSSSFSPLDSSLPEDIPVFTAAVAATPVPSAVPTRGTEPEWALPVSGGAVHTAGYRVSRLCSDQGGSPRRGCLPCPAVPQDHGGQQIKPQPDSRTCTPAPCPSCPQPMCLLSSGTPGGAVSTSDTDCLPAGSGHRARSQGPQGLGWLKIWPPVTGGDEWE